MESVSVPALAEELLDAAQRAQSGRAATTVYGGRQHALRQTVLALLAGHELAEHEGPGEATLQVFRGSVRLSTADRTWRGEAGDLVSIPRERHTLTAAEDAVVVLTVVSPR